MSKRFRIAFSFAGEKREFVGRIAVLLARQFGEEAILYDRYHTAEFSRSDLAFYLPDLYEKEAIWSWPSSVRITTKRNGAALNGMRSTDC